MTSRGQGKQAPGPVDGRARLQIASVTVATSLVLLATIHLTTIHPLIFHLTPAKFCGEESVTRRRAAMLAVGIPMKQNPHQVASEDSMLAKKADGSAKPASAEWPPCPVTCSCSHKEVVQIDPYIGLCLAVKEYIEMGVVDYLYLGGTVQPEFINLGSIFTDCVKRHADNHAWLCIWDSDEFMIIRDGSLDLPTVLRRYEAYGGLGVNWRLFGTSGHKTWPTDGVLQSFTACKPQEDPENLHVNLLANTKYLRGSRGPHFFNYTEGYFAVNTNYKRFEGPFSSPPVDDVLVLNHYVVQSEEDFRFKSARGNGMYGRKSGPFFKRVEKAATEMCDYAVQLGVEVKARLQDRSCLGLNTGANAGSMLYVATGDSHLHAGWVPSVVHLRTHMLTLLPKASLALCIAIDFVHSGAGSWPSF